MLYFKHLSVLMKVLNDGVNDGVKIKMRTYWIILTRQKILIAQEKSIFRINTSYYAMSWNAFPLRHNLYYKCFQWSVLWVFQLCYEVTDIGDSTKTDLIWSSFSYTIEAHIYLVYAVCKVLPLFSYWGFKCEWM